MRWWLPLVLLSRAVAESGLACYQPCGTRRFLCRWPPWGPPGNTSYELTLCYVEPRRCQQHPAGTCTALALPLRSVYVLTNTTAWVEARWGAHLHRSPNLTLYLRKAVKLEPPALGSSLGKAGGRLRLWLLRPRCHKGPQPLQREARYRRPGERTWTRVPCRMERDEAGEEEAVSCALAGSAAVELQLRHKLQHWSSPWSEWSEAFLVPEELQESPAVHYELGRLGADGRRVLRLVWQPVRAEQGAITYALRARILPCRCAEPRAQERLLLLGPEATGHNLRLCAAAYDVALTATNAAGPGPPWRLHVPPEPGAGTELGGEGVHVAGGTVTAQWEAASAGLAYCFEKQPLAATLQQDDCVQREFPANSTHVATGRLAEQGCYRLAVHGWAPERGWATFVLTHRYVGNASLATSLHIDAGVDSAMLRWEPSPRAACPGVLHKYRICYGHEGHNLSHRDADAAAQRHVLRPLRPGTAYRLGVQEVTAEPGAACAPRWRFLTKAQGPWRPNLWYLGILLALPALAALCRWGKERATRRLWPPLPKPRGSEALRFSPADMGQGQRRCGFVQPSERCSRAELLLPQPGPKQDGAAGRPLAPEESPCGYQRQEEPVPTVSGLEEPGLCQSLLLAQEATGLRGQRDFGALPEGPVPL